MKRLICSLAAILILCVNAIPASADGATGDSGPAVPTVSDWAREEVDRARELGLVPNLRVESYLPLTDYTVPITRAQYIEVAMEYVALQQHCSRDGLRAMVSYYLAERKPGWNSDAAVKEVFTDGDFEASIAYYLGIIEGRGDGTFDPEGFITRQEAAVILTHAYGVCGGTLPEETSETSGFTDEDEIADWAKESAAALALWRVMNGMEDGSFSPEEHYTVEQCIITFLRLYENAPVSRKKSNVTPLFTYEQGIKCVINRSEITYEGLRIVGPEATFIRTDLGGVMMATSSLYFVYRDGGVRGIAPGVWNTSWGFTPNKKLEDPHFSEDGKTFYYMVTLEDDVISYMADPGGKILYEKGVYHMAIDVDTGKNQLRREGLPE